MCRLGLAVLPLAFLAACQPATTELTEERRAAVAEELAQSFDAYATAVRQLDLDAVLGLFQQSDDFALAESGEITRSWTAFAQVVRESWPMYASVDSFAWGELHIQVLASNIAVVTTTFDFAASDTTGAPIVMNGTESTVWVQTDGEWKIVNVSETFPTPEPSTEGT